LKQERAPHDDGIESSMGNESVGIRSNKPHPVTLTGDCRTPFSDIDGFRRLVHTDY
jgi:hypothetical protein